MIDHVQSIVVLWYICVCAALYSTCRQGPRVNQAELTMVVSDLDDEKFTKPLLKLLRERDTVKAAICVLLHVAPNTACSDMMPG